MDNLLITHGGAPTAVINASLAGAIIGAKESGFKGRILAARYGSIGLLREDFINITNITDKQIEELKKAPVPRLEPRGCRLKKRIMREFWIF